MTIAEIFHGLLLRSSKKEKMGFWALSESMGQAARQVYSFKKIAKIQI
jgi:hypothetical protein